MRTTRKTITSLDVTEEKIAQLRDKAAATDNVVLVKHCDLANTNVDSFRVVLAALRAEVRS